MRPDESSDAGAARPDRIVVGVSGSVANLAALHAACALAGRLDVPLVAVSAWVPVGGELNYRRAPCPQLLQLWATAARERLMEAFTDAFGGIPPAVNLRPLIVRGDTGPVLTQVANQPGDRLLIGSGRRRTWRSGVVRYCRRHALCGMYVVPPPPMIRDLKRSRRLDHELRTVVRHTT